MGIFEAVVLGTEGFEIAGEGCGVTGDVADFWDFGRGEGAEEGEFGALAGRIEYDGVEALVLGEDFRNLAGGVGADESGVFEAVDLRWTR